MSEHNYLDLLRNILENGEDRPDRTGTGTLSIFAPYYLRFNLEDGFPLLTTKKMFFKGVVDELIWFLSSSTNVNDLPERTQKWWGPWAKEDGSLGPIYGHLFRNIGATLKTVIPAYEKDGIDQIKELERSLKTNPFSRRHVMTMWSPKDLPYQALPCCHGTVIQFYVSTDNRLSCHMYQRSADVFIGLPVNIASYALLTNMLATSHGFGLGTLTISLGDAHIYKNHIDAAKEQLTRVPFEFPKLRIMELKDSVTDYSGDGFELEGYQHHAAIKAEISV